MQKKKKKNQLPERHFGLFPLSALKVSSLNLEPFFTPIDV